MHFNIYIGVCVCYYVGYFPVDTVCVRVLEGDVLLYRVVGPLCIENELCHLVNNPN